MDVGLPNDQGTKTIIIAKKSLSGHVIDAGNPHLVIFEKTTPEWLLKHGHSIETHPQFPHRTNVEFVWKDHAKNIYHMLVFERGCGMTLACSTGAAASLFALYQAKKISLNQKINLKLPGGTLMTYLDDHHHVIQEGSAELTFVGETYHLE
jgi:diaminopimelate epimerase